MDLIILIFITLFVVALFSLFLVYKFGIKEKSYEEALAEQRQHTSVLLGAKPKPKEKKNKKASKKGKEKNQSEDLDNVENKENNQPSKLHVEFKEQAEEVPIKEEITIPVVKEPKQKKKVRPILVNKRERSPQKSVVELPIVNHFEENPPKDDFELLRSNSKEDILKQEPVKEKLQVKEKKHIVETVKNKKNSKTVTPDVPKQPAPIVPTEETKPEEKVVVDGIPQTNGIPVGNAGKEKKKKKSEFNTRQQLTAERDGLINSVRKAELSKTEIQLLIDMLLNKQLEAPAVIDDWSEGKSDPIQKLKKQLSEKEKLLAEEQQALAGVQSKLREIRSEQQAEKVQLQQKIRGLEEVIQSKQIELQASNNRFQVNAQKIQQLQAELNGEIMKNRSVLEENTNLQIQIQQIESDIIGKLRSDIEELGAQNHQLQQMAAEKEIQHQHFLLQMGTIEKSYKDMLQESEKKLEMSLRQESEWKREISNLNSSLKKQFEEQRKLDHTLAQLNEQLRISNTEKTDSSKLISKLNLELQQAKEDLNRLGELSEGKNNHKVEILNLSNELSSTKNELSSTKNELSSTKKELSSRIEELQQTEKKYKTELETSNKKYLMVQQELEEQKSKNNALREKNWKVIEALKTAESKCNSQVSINAVVDTKKLSSEIISKEQEIQRQFIQRLFPEIEDLKSVGTENWQDQYALLITNYIKNLKEQKKNISPMSSPPSSPQKVSEVAKLQSQIHHYKNIIDDTEGMLNRLQKHVEQEEMNWRSQVAAKDAELEHLRETLVTQLKTKLLNVENQLSIELNEKQKLLEECQFLKEQKSQLNGDSTVTIEKLSEEINRLREQLSLEQTKNGDIGVCLKAQNCNNSTNGPSFIEHCLSSSSSIASSLIEEYKKPKNKKRKKKAERHQE